MTDTVRVPTPFLPNTLPPASPDTNYFQRSRHPLPMLVALLPLVLLVEFGLSWTPDGDATRVLARLQLQELLEFFTLAPVVVVHALGGLVVLVLLVQHVLEKRRWRVRPLDPPLLLLEGCIAAVPLLVVGAALLPVSTPLLAGASEVSTALLETLVVASAAALSEELIFRMGGMSLVHWITVDVLKLRASTGTTIAVVTTAVAFMLYHDPWSMNPQAATFIMVSGLYLGTLFAQRGFATAVLAHAAYDVIALT